MSADAHDYFTVLSILGAVYMELSRVLFAVQICMKTSDA